MEKERKSLVVASIVNVKNGNRRLISLIFFDFSSFSLPLFLDA